MTCHTRDNKTLDLFYANSKEAYNSSPLPADIKALLEEKTRAFRSGNKEELKAVQKEMRRKIREGKNSYRRKTSSSREMPVESGKALKKFQGRGLQTPRLQGIIRG